MRVTIAFIAVLGMVSLVIFGSQPSMSYPSSPMHGGRNCMTCHKATGPWQDNSLMLIDILDARTEQSYRTGDREFTIPFAPGEEKVLLGLYGVQGKTEKLPRLVGWSILDDELVKNSTLAAPKLPSGWEINRPYGFSYIDGRHDLYPGARLAQVPFAVRPTAGAKEVTLSLHMLVQGDRDISGNQTSYQKATVKLQEPTGTPVAAIPSGNSSAPQQSPGGLTSEAMAREGMNIFREKKCGACHQLKGIGGTMGPSLTHVGRTRSREWIEKYLRDPKSVFPNSYKRPVELPEDKWVLLLDFLQSQK